jgi:hypothetical protein
MVIYITPAIRAADDNVRGSFEFTVIISAARIIIVKKA